MQVYVVIYYSTLVGLYTSAVDAAVASKRLSGSTVTTCRLNAGTETGQSLLTQ